MSNATLWPEYGARVKITGIEGFPDGTRGTIVGITETPDDWFILFDTPINGIRNVEWMFGAAEFDVTQTPSESAHNLTRRMSADEVLAVLAKLADAFNPALTVYKSAVVFELIRLNKYAEDTLYGISYLVGHGDWESGSCTEPDRDGGYWPQDDGYGYPIYSVED